MASAENLTYFCFLFFVSLSFTLLFHLFIKICTNSRLKHPPGPPALPIIGHLHLLSSSLPKSYQKLALRYGPIMQIRIGFSEFLIISSASVAKEIFKIHDIDFASRFESGPSEYSIYKGLGFLTGPYGAYWKFMRKLCVTQLFAGSQLDRFNHIREHEVMKLLKSLMKYCSEGVACDLGVELTTLANNVIFRMTMSKRFSKYPNEAKELRNLIVEMMAVAANFSINEAVGFLKKIDLFGNGKRLKAAMIKYDERVEQILKDYEDSDDDLRNPETEERDLVDILLETYRDTDAEVKLTRDRIKFFLLELFMASIDTISAVLRWAMLELINRPQIFNKLREEINSVVGSSRLIKESDLPNLPYLQAIVKESLRLHTPAVLIHRESTRDCKVNGFDIKANSKTFINAYAIMRDPNAWKDPEEFIPERFLVNNNGRVELDQDGIQMKTQNFDFLPFGGGRRYCPGAAHTNMVMHAVIGALTQCFDWKIKDGENAHRNVSSGILGAAAKPLVCYPSTHFNPFEEQSSMKTPNPT